MGRVLVACEESQAVTKEFRKLGHEAYSCDIQECSGGHPEWHIVGNAIKVLKGGKFKTQSGNIIFIEKWDMLIAHPPCTYMSKAGARWMYPTAGKLSEDRFEKSQGAKLFFMEFLNSNIDKIVIENPVPLKIVGLPKYTQSVQPYEYGHEFSKKKTLLWIKGLPDLIPTDVRNDFKPYLPSNTGGKKRGQKYMFKNISQKDSSKTFPGIAKAMAEQWGKII